MHGRAQRLLHRFNRLQRQPRRPRSDDDRGDHDMQPVESARRQKTRDRIGAALDQDAVEAEAAKRFHDRGWRDRSCAWLHRQQFHARRQGGSLRITCDDNTTHAVSGEDARVARQLAMRIEHHARRMRSACTPNSELRIIGKHRPDAHHDRIHQRPQAMQMRQAVLAVDIVRMSGGRRDPAIQRLADLPDNHRAALAQRPQRTKKRLPGFG